MDRARRAAVTAGKLVAVAERPSCRPAWMRLSPVAPARHPCAARAAAGRRAALNPAALALIGDWCPDLVLTDNQMPRMTGLQLAHRLRQAPATAMVPIIMLCAAHRPHPDTTPLVDRWPTKPIAIRVLREQVAEVLHAARAGGPLTVGVRSWP